MNRYMYIPSLSYQSHPFIIEVHPGDLIPSHHHDCRKVITYLAGRLEVNGKVLSAGDQYTLYPRNDHYIKNVGEVLARGHVDLIRRSKS